MKDWRNGPAGGTPINAAALKELEERTSFQPFLLDVAGHSLPGAGGTAWGDHNGYVDRLAGLLGTMRRRNASVGGAIACWPTAAGTGDGGHSWVKNKLTPPGPLAGVPVQPMRSIALAHFGLNDLGRLGGQTLRPFREALTAISSLMCAGRAYNVSESAWTWGAGMTTIALFTNWTYLHGGLKYTNAAADPATMYGELTVPDYEAGQVIAVSLVQIPGASAGADTLTIGVTVDNVAQPDVVWPLNKGGVADAENGKTNGLVLRFGRADCGQGIALASGSRKIRLSFKAATVVGAYFAIDGAWVEPDPLDGPLLVLPNANRCVDYTLWNGLTHGPGAGTDPMTDASVALMNTAIGQVAAQFPSRTVVPDIDTPLAKDPLNFSADKAHPNNRGHGIVAEACYQATRESPLATVRKMARAQRRLGPAWVSEKEAGRATMLLNSWTNISGAPPFEFYKDELGQIHMRGAVGGGTAVGAVIIRFFEYPRQDTRFYGRNNAGAQQVWLLKALDGTLLVESGGDTVKSELIGEVVWAPEQSQ